jgi:hypothetical protein
VTPAAAPDARYDEIRVISLPPPQTAAVNRLLREEQGWTLLDVRVTQSLTPPADGSPGGSETLVVYVLGHTPETS